jgi:tRNA(Ile)-lysidine synthase TilS/MesJ
MNRCNKCAMPDTRPDHVFENGVCPACRVRDLEVDWEEREKRLLELLDRHQGEVIVPSSGGKDSTYQVIRLLELGANPTIVTATTCHLSPRSAEGTSTTCRGMQRPSKSHPTRQSGPS